MGFKKEIKRMKELLIHKDSKKEVTRMVSCEKSRSSVANDASKNWFVQSNPTIHQSKGSKLYEAATLSPMMPEDFARISSETMDLGQIQYT